MISCKYSRIDRESGRRRLVFLSLKRSKYRPYAYMGLGTERDSSSGLLKWLLNGLIRRNPQGYVCETYTFKRDAAMLAGSNRHSCRLKLTTTTIPFFIRILHHSGTRRDSHTPLSLSEGELFSTKITKLGSFSSVNYGTTLATPTVEEAVS